MSAGLAAAGDSERLAAGDSVGHAVDEELVGVVVAGDSEGFAAAGEFDRLAVAEVAVVDKPVAVEESEVAEKLDQGFAAVEVDLFPAMLYY